MEVILSTRQVDVQECEVLVTGLFEDERPLRGSSGWVDWRLNGRISRCLIEKRLVGIWKETTLIPSEGRILPSLILWVGFGKVREYSYPRLRELFPYLLGTLKKLNVSKICFSLPEDAEHQVEPGKVAEVLMEGIADSMDEADRFRERKRGSRGCSFFSQKERNGSRKFFLEFKPPNRSLRIV